MRFKTLLEQYNFSLKALTVTMPLSAAVFVIVGIVELIQYINSIFWVSFIFFGIAGLVIVEYFVIRRYLLKKIAELQEDEDRKNQDNQQL